MTDKNTALIATEPGAGNGGALSQVTAQDVETVRNTVFKGCSDAEMRLFLHDCQRQGVHPLDRLIHPQIRTDKVGTRTYTAITSIDLFRTRAEETGCYAGNDDPIFGGAPKTESFIAHATVYKMVQGARCPFTASARWFEYKPPDGKDFKWNQSPHIMLGKCAEALALRKAFPRQLARLYTDDEMEHVPQDREPTAAAPKVVRPEPAPVVSPEGAKPKRVTVKKLAPEESIIHAPSEPPPSAPAAPAATITRDATAVGIAPTAISIPTYQGQVLTVDEAKPGVWRITMLDKSEFATMSPEIRTAAEVFMQALCQVVITFKLNSKGTKIATDIEEVKA